MKAQLVIFFEELIQKEDCNNNLLNSSYFVAHQHTLTKRQKVPKESKFFLSNLTELLRIEMMKVELAIVRKHSSRSILFDVTQSMIYQ